MRVLAKIIVAGMCGFMARSSAPAQAALSFTGSFGSFGSAEAQFNTPTGVAVDEQTSVVYVVDQGNDRVQYFTATGGYLGQFTGEAAPLSSPTAIAIDNDTASSAHGDVYVADVGHDVIDRFSPTGTYLGQIAGTCSFPGPCPGGEAPFTAPLLGLAADAAGNLWAYDSAGALDEFTSTGSFIKQTTTGRRGEPGLAVDTSDDVYLMFRCGCMGEYNAAFAQQAASETEAIEGTALTVEQSTNNLYVDTGKGVTEYGPFGEPLTPIADFGSKQLSDGGGSGIAVNAATHAIYVADLVGDKVDVFGVGLPPATPITEAAAEVEGTSAVLRGVLTSGSESVRFHFAYNDEADCSGQGALTTPSSEAESSAREETTITGLEPHRKYTFCFIAENEAGATLGQPESFETTGAAPAIVSETARAAGPNEAELEAEVNPNNEETNYRFEVALDQALIDATTAAGANAINGFAPGGQLASARVAGLAPNTTYFYRAVAENEQTKHDGASSVGLVQEFRTAEARPNAVTGYVLDVGAESADVTGEVNPYGVETTYQYEYGLTEAYGLLSPTAIAGNGSGEVTAPAPLEDLAVNSVYHYRLVATNDIGTTYGKDEAFTTPGGSTPSAVTGSASGVTANTASVAGMIETLALPVTYWFDVGTETGSYGSATGRSYVGPGFGDLPVTLALQNLEAGTTYHYRVVASNRYGMSVGADQSFTTLGVPSPLTQPSTAPLIAVPAIAFPSEASANIVPAAKKTLTRAQQLAQRLRECERDRRQAKRAECERRARARYGGHGRK